MAEVIKQHIKPSLYDEPQRGSIYRMELMKEVLIEIMNFKYIPPHMDIIKAIRGRMYHYCTDGEGSYPQIEWVYAYILYHDDLNINCLTTLRDRLAFINIEHDDDEDRTKLAIMRTLIVEAPLMKSEVMLTDPIHLPTALEVFNGVGRFYVDIVHIIDNNLFICRVINSFPENTYSWGDLIYVKRENVFRIDDTDA